MFTKRIIPCLDVTNGRVVKGTNFLNLRDAGDPVELAKRYNEEGADEMVFLDITATSDNRQTLIELVERTAEELFIPYTVGGGVRSLDNIRDILNAGADKVAMNSAAVKNPQLIQDSSHRFGAQCTVLAIDAKRCAGKSKGKETPSLKEIQIDEQSQWEVYVAGGRIPTGIDAIKWAKLAFELGAGEILLTSMDQDGTKAGYDLDLIQATKNITNIPIIASGGAGNTQHIVDALKICDAALLASLLHFKELSIEEIKQGCIQNRLPIRSS